jgi:hypothetical protein
LLLTVQISAHQKIISQRIILFNFLLILVLYIFQMSNLNFVVSVIINDSKDPLKLMFNKSDKIQQIFENHHIKTMLENNDLKSLKIFNA